MRNGRDAVVVKPQFRLQRIVRREDALCLKQWHTPIAEAAKLLRLANALALQKHIQQTYRCGTLSRVVRQRQQLKARQSRRTQTGFDIFLIQPHCEIS